MNEETIAAIATAPGRGGVGVIRVSGSNLLPFAFALSGKTPKPRYATLADFKAADGSTVDSGILLFFPASRIPLPVKTCSNCRATAARW